jgi:hypothetical protein
VEAASQRANEFLIGQRVSSDQGNHGVPEQERVIPVVQTELELLEVGSQSEPLPRLWPPLVTVRQVGNQGLRLENAGDGGPQLAENRARVRRAMAWWLAGPRR